MTNCYDCTAQKVGSGSGQTSGHTDPSRTELPTPSLARVLLFFTTLALTKVPVPANNVLGCRWIWFAIDGFTTALSTSPLMNLKTLNMQEGLIVT